jgi:hypothetical protein
MGTISEESIRAWNTHHNFGAVSELVLEPAGIVRDVTLGDRDVMLLLSSEAPVEVHNIKAGPESVLFLGHMSSTAISIVLGMFDLKFTPNDTGVYKVVFQPEHSALIRCRLWAFLGFLTALIRPYNAFPVRTIEPGLALDTVEQLPKKKVTAETFATDPEILCTICHSSFAVGSEVYDIPCKHHFHLNCLAFWLRTSGTCPLCRGLVIP